MEYALIRETYLLNFNANLQLLNFVQFYTFIYNKKHIELRRQLTL